jgi:SAM-dependent methyltransferase
MTGSGKPKHLGPEYGAQFRDASIAATYRYRPPYPQEAIDVIAGLLPAGAPRVLDVGCGSGDLAIPLSLRVGHVDGLDPSAALLARARRREGGDAANVRWIEGMAEDAPLEGPYGLVTAGACIHWMEWSVVFDRFREMLVADGEVVLAERTLEPLPFGEELRALCSRYSTNRDFRPYDAFALLTEGGWFRPRGEHRTRPVPFEQPVEEYVASFHSRNGLSQDRMGAEAARAFDDALTELVARHCPDGRVRLEVGARLVWGR